jgi:thiamine phosphate synthase YjbQ (UPF0047 family)
VHTEQIRIQTGSREQVYDITKDCHAFLRRVTAADGLLHVWVPHATAGLAVIETGAGSETDLLSALRELLPADDRWRHQHGSPGHGRDHLRQRAGARRATHTGHLAVDLPGGHQPRQPGPHGPAELPGRLSFLAG